MPPLEAVKMLVSIMMSVSMSNKGNPLKLRHYDISRAHFQGTAQRLIYITLPAKDRQKYGEDKVGRLIKSMYGSQDASHILQLVYVSLICGEVGGFRRGNHNADLFHNPNQDVRMAVHGDYDALKHIDSLLKSKYTAKDMGTLGFEDADVKSLLLLNCVFRVGVDQTGQYLDIEPDLRHAPLITSESGCSTNTKAVSTPREKLQDKLVLDGRRSPVLKKDEATRYRSACMRLSYLARDMLDLAETAKHLAQRMSEPREFDFVPLKRAARYLVGKPKAVLRYRRQKHVHKITVFVASDFAGDPVSRKSTTGSVVQIGNHTVKSGSTFQSLTTLSVGEAEFFYAVVKGGQVVLSLRAMYQDLGIPMKIEIQSDSSTANSVTDRLGAAQRTKHTDTWYSWTQKRMQDGDLSIKKVPAAKNCADVGKLQHHCKFAGLVFY